MKKDNILYIGAQAFQQYAASKRDVLCGTRARGDYREQRDYDVAIYGELLASDKAALRSFCAEDLPTLHKIDLIFMSEQDGTAIAESIKREGIIFYDKAGK